MIVRSEIIALEKDLDEYKSKLRKSDHRWVLAPHKWTVENDKKEVGAGRMSLTDAKERRYKSVIISLLRAKERYESNRLSADGLAQVRAEHRRKRTILQMSAQP